MSITPGNLGRNERLVSAGAGALLSAMALRSGGPLIRLIAGVGGLAFLARALAGHCGMKSALSGESTLRDGMLEQWHHMKAQAERLGERAGDRAAVTAASSEKVVREQGPHPTEPAGREGASWMSHQNGRVTGSGVTPGTGDAEAGTSAPL